MAAFNTAVGACECDGGIVLGDCTDFQTCFEVSGGVSAVDFEVEMSGWANGSCSTCSDLNNTFIFTGMAYGTSGTRCFLNKENFETICGVTVSMRLRITINSASSNGNVEVDVGFSGETGHLFDVAGGGGLVGSTDGRIEVQNLCDGNDATGIARYQNGGARCSSASTVITVRRA